MARGNIFQGQASGKLGDTVLLVRNGKQVARVYTTSGARTGDTASMAARLQRVRFGAASNQWQLYRYICTRMYRKGRNNNQSDYNYFVKRNIENLPYLTKLENADGVCCMMPGQFSEGTLGRIELLSRYGVISATQRAYVAITDTINQMGTSIAWSVKVGVLKENLKRVYPNARKITYLIIATSENTIEETGEVFVSQFSQHYPVIVDLYSETVAGENDKTIKEYFVARVNNENLLAVLNEQSAAFCSPTASFNIISHDEGHDSIIESLGLLMFATDDLVSDCYTTVLPQNSVNITRGVYAVWGGYRTDEALKVASDSYGYQTGVLRDEISASGIDLAKQTAAYAARVRMVDASEADDLMRQVSEAGQLRARQIRKVVESESE